MRSIVETKTQVLQSLYKDLIDEKRKNDEDEEFLEYKLFKNDYQRQLCDYADVEYNETLDKAQIKFNC